MLFFGTAHCILHTTQIRWYWGAVVASRKAFIAFISRYLSDPGLQIHWIVLYFSISLMANLYFQPYVGVKGIRNEDSRKLHWTDATGLFCLLLTAWSGLFFNMTPTCDQDEPPPPFGVHHKSNVFQHENSSSSGVGSSITEIKSIEKCVSVNKIK